MAKRARESVAAEAAAAAPPPAKKKKNAPRRYYCSSCDADKTDKSFPDYNPSPDCDHLINTCKNCLKQWVNVQVEGGLHVTGGERDGDGEKVFGIKCVECPGIMRAVNVQLAVTKTTYAQFNKAERHHIAETTPGWRWCLSPKCNAGQVHISISKNDDQPKGKSTKARTRSRKASTTEKPNICTCNTCGSKACVPCDRPYHEGESCEIYQRRTKDRMDEEVKSLKEIQRVTRKCPSCSKNIQKNGGCPVMFCSQCNISFCWQCMGVYYQGYCKCHPRPGAPATERQD